MTDSLRLVLDSITPMLASPSDDLDLQTLVGTHAFDEKLDGNRAFAAIDGPRLILRSRSGRDMTSSFPDLEATLAHIGPIVLDGEIVTTSGKFQDVAKRDKATKPAAVAAAMRAHPAVFVAFDVLRHGDEDVRHLPWTARRALLDALDTNDHWRTSRVSLDPAHYDVLKSEGGEGVVAKRMTARYSNGRSRDWLKFKTVQSVTCVVAGFETGSGARAHMGAIHLAMLGPEGFVIVGKAGSGFSAKTAASMRATLEDVAATGNVLATPVVEIQCLGVTRDGKLRQPIFKGIRSDLTLVDATLDQLANLNTT